MWSQEINLLSFTIPSRLCFNLSLPFWLEFFRLKVTFLWSKWERKFLMDVRLCLNFHFAADYNDLLLRNIILIFVLRFKIILNRACMILLVKLSEDFEFVWGGVVGLTL